MSVYSHHLEFFRGRTQQVIPDPSENECVLASRPGAHHITHQTLDISGKTLIQKKTVYSFDTEITYTYKITFIQYTAYLGKRRR